jgi:hypothetical protein
MRFRIRESWSILLSYQNFTNCDWFSTGWTRTISVYKVLLFPLFQ